MLLRVSVVPSLLLCALLISALGPQTKPCRPTRDGFALLQNIRNKEPSWGNETMLYTPTKQDFQSCPNSTLSCMKSEMEVLLEEWDITNRKDRLILRAIDNRITQTQESGCVPCERFPERPALTFLDFLDFIFKQINAKCSSAS